MNYLKNTLSAFALITIFSLTSVQQVQAHCEVPCGIYEDSLRIALIQEHIVTIEKSMNQIVALSEEGDKNYNQIVRWVNNKEKHADEIQEIVSQYFLHQRIKPTGNKDQATYLKYQQQLEHLHHLLVYAMKCKQTTDLSYIKQLRASLNKFEHTYFVKHVHHEHRHDPTHKH